MSFALATRELQSAILQSSLDDSIGMDDECLRYEGPDTSSVSESVQDTQPALTTSPTSEVRAPQRVTKIVPLRTTSELPGNYLSLKSWEGVVTKILDQEIKSILYSDDSEPPVEATIPLSEVSEDDLELVEEGAIFYWNIGYEVTRFGQRKRNSTIRFRRLPAWTPRELEQAKKSARGLLKYLEWD